MRLISVSVSLLQAKERGCKTIVCASGGNAGLAAAYSAQALKIPARIVLPKSTPNFVADKLRTYYVSLSDLLFFSKSRFTFIHMFL